MTQIKNIHSSPTSRIKNDSGNLIQSKPVRVFSQEDEFSVSEVRGGAGSNGPDASSLVFPSPCCPTTRWPIPSHRVTHSMGSRECFSTLAACWESSGGFKKHWRWGLSPTNSNRIGLQCGLGTGISPTALPTPQALPLIILFHKVQSSTQGQFILIFQRLPRTSVFWFPSSQPRGRHTDKKKHHLFISTAWEEGSS